MSAKLNAFANVATATRNVCQCGCGQELTNETGRAAINLDLYFRAPGEDEKQERIAHHSTTVHPDCAARIFAAMLPLHPKGAGYETTYVPEDAPADDAEKSEDKDAATA